MVNLGLRLFLRVRSLKNAYLPEDKNVATDYIDAFFIPAIQFLPVSILTARKLHSLSCGLEPYMFEFPIVLSQKKKKKEKKREENRKRLMSTEMS